MPCLVRFVVTTVGDLFRHVLNCREAAKLYRFTEQQLFEYGIVSTSDTSLPSLKRLLLDLSAYECCDGLFYCLAVQYGQQTVVRYQEGGCYCGFMNSHYLQHISSTSGIDMSDILLMPNFTPEDVSERKKFVNERRARLSTASSRHSGQCIDVVEIKYNKC
jgi:hypothetical protein